VEIARSVRAALRVPRQVVGRLAGVGRTLATSAQRPPEMPWNAPISAHRRWENARVPLSQVKTVREAATASELTAGRCSINDVVVAACSGALRSFLQGREVPVEGLVLKAMIPVSMRTEDEAGSLGNRVSMVPADLPVGEADPLWRLRIAHENMSELKASGAAVAGEDLIRMTSYLPPTVLASASRLLARNVPVNTTITNIPGPQFPLYCMGAKMLEAFPYVGIVDGMALTIAVLSYDGNLGFGITGDRDLLPDLALLAGGIEDAFAELEEAVGAPAARKNGAKP
jgi:WS/DGAT/MGAT family acyltransferase